MTTKTSYPRVTSVKPLAGKRLLVGFENGISKTYDCTPLLEHEPFVALSNDSLFRSVQADPHGYGIVWTEELDLAESELWLHGEVTEPGVQAER